MALHPEEGIHNNTLTLDIDSQRLTFSAKAGRVENDWKEYACTIDLYDKIIPEQTKKSLSNRSLQLILYKKTNQAEYWPRLTQDKARSPHIKVDFEKSLPLLYWMGRHILMDLPIDRRQWVDEDEQGTAHNLSDYIQKDYDSFGRGLGVDKEMLAGISGAGGLE
ncbi:hypothetical protein BJY00DRAFT_308476 [Aspergillus carlsbadensis]|nr:hypothetical protein BJY00DRAFT_308476 [Aspergillus carlsbadensis]